MSTFKKTGVGAARPPKPRTKPKTSKFKKLPQKSGAVKATHFQQLVRKSRGR